MSRMPVPPRLTVVRVVAALLVAAVVGAVVALTVASVMPTSYASQRQVLIRVWSIDALLLSGQTTDISATDLADAATILTSADVINGAIDELGSTDLTAVELSRLVSAEPAQTSDFVVLTVLGPSPAEADERALAVSDSFATVVREKVLSSAATIVADPQGTFVDDGGVQSDIRARALAIAAVDPVQVYRIGITEPSGIGRATATAAGAVAGLGVGALAVILIAFAAPRLHDPDDVTDELSLASTRWSPDDAATPGGLSDRLHKAAGGGTIAVCPASPDDDTHARAFATWLTDSATPGAHRGATGRPEVLVLDSPTGGLSAARPAAAGVAAVVLVTHAGARRDTVGRARTVLDTWRSVDAVVLVE